MEFEGYGIENETLYIYVSDCTESDHTKLENMGLEPLDDNYGHCVGTEDAETWTTGLNDFKMEGKTMTNDIMFYVVEFLENDGSTYSIAIKTTHHPSKDEIKEFLKEDMHFFGYSHVYDFYEVDEEEVYVGYDTDNIDNWPVLGN